MYEFLVPRHQREAILDVGVLGGVSMTVCLTPFFPPLILVGPGRLGGDLSGHGGCIRTDRRESGRGKEKEKSVLKPKADRTIQ